MKFLQIFKKIIKIQKPEAGSGINEQDLHEIKKIIDWYSSPLEEKSLAELTFCRPEKMIIDPKELCEN